jgi:hypothetical protein
MSSFFYFSPCIFYRTPLFSVKKGNFFPKKLRKRGKNIEKRRKKRTNPAF